MATRKSILAKLADVNALIEQVAGEQQKSPFLSEANKEELEEVKKGAKAARVKATKLYQKQVATRPLPKRD